MSDSLKYIVAELNKEPYNKGYTLISFDSLIPLSLLQVLTDVLAEIDSTQKADVRNEASDETAIRILNILRIFKFRPPTDQEGLANFRNGIVQGDKHVLQPIIEWLLKNRPDLKERAYLARYLVKVDVAPDFMADAKIAELYEQYEQLLRNFAETHKDLVALRKSGYSTGEIKKDIASMEDEKEQIIKRVDRLKRKIPSSTNSEVMLAAARNLRIEKDRETQIFQQKAEQRNLITQMEQKVMRLQQQIKDAKQSMIGMNSTGLLTKLMEEVQTNSYLVEHRLPQETKQLQQVIQELKKVVLEPAMGQSDLDSIQQKIRETSNEINKLYEKKMAMSVGEDNLSGSQMYKQQASIVRNKKENTAEQLQQAREEEVKMEAVCQQKRQAVQSVGGDSLLKADDYKRFVNELRSKNTEYKEKRLQLSQVKAEAGLLTRTEQLLATRLATLNKQLTAYETSKGVEGFHQTQSTIEKVSSQKSDYDATKGKTLEEISLLVQQINNKIQNKKSTLAPMIAELRTLRPEAQEMQAKHTDLKTSYDRAYTGLETNWIKLEQEVHSYMDEISVDESRYHLLQELLEDAEHLQKRAAEEAKMYTSGDGSEKKISHRERLSRKLQEQESHGKMLRDRQKNLSENQEASVRQVKMWRDVERLIQLKIKLLQQRSQGSQPVAAAKGTVGGTDRLIL